MSAANQEALAAIYESIENMHSTTPLSMPRTLSFRRLRTDSIRVDEFHAVLPVPVPRDLERSAAAAMMKGAALSMLSSPLMSFTNQFEFNGTELFSLFDSSNQVVAKCVLMLSTTQLLSMSRWSR
jgi:hypothetical protein